MQGAVLASPNRPDLASSAAEAAAWLLLQVEKEGTKERQRALERLIGLHLGGLLDDSKTRKLGDVLWMKRNSDGLPNLANYSCFGLLDLPHPPEVDVAAAVKDQMLRMRDSSNLQRDPNGKITVHSAWGEQPVIWEAALGTKSVVNIPGEVSGSLSWTSDEATALFSKARAWWDTDKQTFAFSHNNPFGSMALTPVLRTLDRLGQFLARVVLPFVDWSSVDEWHVFDEWLEDVLKFSPSPTVALPYLLIRRPSRVDHVALRLGTMLESDIEGGASSAAKALHHWILLNDRTPTPPSSLLNALVNRVAFRQKAGIKKCLSQLLRIVVDKPDSIAPSHANLLAASLEPWRQVIQLNVDKPGRNDFDEADVPGLRALVAGLAGGLNIWYKLFVPDGQEPSSIATWRELCNADPLPEVRTAFDSCRSLRLV